MKFGGGEQFARAFGRFGIDFAMKAKFESGGGLELAEELDQFDQGGGLAWVGLVMAKVADEANADGDFVEAVAGEVAPLDLLGPACAHFNLAIARVGAVPDDEVVGHAIFHAALFVIRVENARVASPRTTVVNDDILPRAKAVARGIDLSAHGGNKRNFGRGGYG